MNNDVEGRGRGDEGLGRGRGNRQNRRAPDGKKEGGRGRGGGGGRGSSSRGGGRGRGRQAGRGRQGRAAGTGDNKKKKNGREEQSRNRGGEIDTANAASTSATNQRKTTTAKKKKVKEIFAPHIPLEEALQLYANTSGEEQGEGNLRTVPNPRYVRGKMRVAGSAGMRIKAFVSCDRGSLRRDVLIIGLENTNRALDGDVVFVELTGPVEERKAESVEKTDAIAEEDDEAGLSEAMDDLSVGDEEDVDFDALASSSDEIEESTIEEPTTWRQDTAQRTLWDPVVDLRRHSSIKSEYSSMHGSFGPAGSEGGQGQQMQGRVVHVCASRDGKPRVVVGTLKKQTLGQNGRILLVPSNKALPYFVVPRDAEKYFRQEAEQQGNAGEDGALIGSLYKAEYNPEAWLSGMRFPPARKVTAMGNCFDPEDETQALLTGFDVNHGEFEPEVLRDVERAVKSGRTKTATVSGADGADGEDLGWSPTKAMYKGRKDYRKERIFTIDPTTAKDLDDALHIKPLPNGQVEIGVHIADVSHFIKPHSHVDKEAAYRATTVYLVDRTVPMLPRPLCEIACSLNENVERLAFSCVWVMNMDGTMAKEDEDGTNGARDRGRKGKGGKSRPKEKVWYGRTVIKSCSRLDYNTAQNIIDGKCGNEGDTNKDVSEEVWPRSRRPTGGHTMLEVAGDVRLMHKVAMARRRLRFDNGALALHGVKLVFKLGDDKKTPELCKPYPIKDSNRLVEEYMLMANYLVAQRLITHAGDLALLRQHPPPLEQGLDDVAEVARQLGFTLDITNSASLQESLRRISHDCTDDVILQGVTELLMAPMQPAEYIAAGAAEDPMFWRHFALNIPYYTHFTSPIRRYADVIVHRLLQATIDGPDAVKNYYQGMEEINSIASHCNDKRMGSKKAQERSDRVFLSLYLRENPVPKVMAIVVSVGEKAFTVFVPSLGLNQIVKLEEEEHAHLKYKGPDKGDTRKRILVQRRSSTGGENGQEQAVDWTGGANELEIRVFCKVYVSCVCKMQSPIDVKVMLVGPYVEEGED